MISIYIHIYKGIAAHRSRLKDKESLHKLNLREAEADLHLSVRLLRERESDLGQLISDKQAVISRDIDELERRHKEDLQKLDAKVACSSFLLM